MALALFGGCGDDRFEGGRLPAGAPVFQLQSGAPVVVNPAGGPGYGISANEGGVFRLVFTAGNVGVNRFQGSVWSPRRILEVVPGCEGFCPLESNDFVSRVRFTDGAERVDFDASTDGGLDGFDFVVDAEPVFFDLLVDGVRSPRFVFFPIADPAGTIAQPAAVPFALVAR